MSPLNTANATDLIREMSFGSLSALDTVDSNTSGPHSGECVVMITPYSTGCCIAQDIQRRGYQLLCLWNQGFSDDMKKHVPNSCKGLKYLVELTELDSLDETIQAVHDAAGNLKIAGVVCGGEAGVDLSDALSERMGMALTNGTDIPNRRDKKVQQELIRDAGLRSVRQAGGGTFSEVQSFLKTERYPVVLKPLDSAGSDGVKLCYTFEEAQEHFHHLLATEMVNGGSCDTVLCQEYLRGREYVVDHVSRDGVHKTVMCWVYDKRPANGAQFVYHGVIPVDSESEEAKLLIPYVRGVLDALGVKNGPSHGEVIITDDGPCLVEMNCRAHGGDGNWQSLCSALCGGYTQVNATVDCYLDADKFATLPNKPPSPFKASGQEVDLVSFQSGVVTATPGFDKIRKLESFVLLESHVKTGVVVSKTIDLVTDIGNVILMHPDSQVLEQDIAFIREIEKIPGALFELEADSESDSDEDEKKEEEEDVVFPILLRTLSTPKNQRYGYFERQPLPRKHHRVRSDMDVVGPLLLRTMSVPKNPRKLSTEYSRKIYLQSS